MAIMVANMVVASTDLDLGDYEATGVDLDHLVKNAMRNHVGRRRNQNDMDEKYGKQK
jgi:hypothetical protein